MNRYKVMLQSDDQRVFEVTVKADGITDDGYFVKFWRKWGPLGLFRYNVHYIGGDALLSVIRDGGA